MAAATKTTKPDAIGTRSRLSPQNEMTASAELLERIRNASNKAIVEAMASPGSYTEEAYELYVAEGIRRGISENQVLPVAQKIQQDEADKKIKAFSFKGIGTRLYGKRRYREDSSYQTTKWFTVLFLPIYPIGTYRVIRRGTGKLSVLETLPVDWRQAVDTYVFVYGSWAFVVLLVSVLERFQSELLHNLLPLTLMLPFLFLYFVRKSGRRRRSSSPRSG